MPMRSFEVVAVRARRNSRGRLRVCDCGRRQQHAILDATTAVCCRRLRRKRRSWRSAELTGSAGSRHLRAACVACRIRSLYYHPTIFKRDDGSCAPYAPRALLWCSFTCAVLGPAAAFALPGDAERAVPCVARASVHMTSMASVRCHATRSSSTQTRCASHKANSLQDCAAATALEAPASSSSKPSSAAAGGTDISDFPTLGEALGDHVLLAQRDVRDVAVLPRAENDCDALGEFPQVLLKIQGFHLGHDIDRWLRSTLARAMERPGYRSAEGSELVAGTTARSSSSSSLSSTRADGGRRRIHLRRLIRQGMTSR